jgi:sugar/nucleoside kinase (ribokinase family)
MEERGVDTSLVIRDENCKTPRIIVNVRKDGSHKFLVGKGINYGLHREDIVPGTLDQTRILAIGSLFVLDSLDREKSVADALKFCRDAGGEIVADMTYDVCGVGPKFYEDIYPLIDFLVPSWDEAFYATGLEREEEMADYFLERGVRNVVIKLGSEGSFFKNAQERFYTDPYIVTPIDTTGCGDNFTGGFIHAYLKGQSMRECMQFASAAGALSSQGLGANSYIRSEKMVLDFMERTPVRKVER